jgi:hypothetical protein
MDALAVTEDKFNAALQCLPDERDRQDPAPRARFAPRPAISRRGYLTLVDAASKLAKSGTRNQLTAHWLNFSRVVNSLAKRSSRARTSSSRAPHPSISHVGVPSGRAQVTANCSFAARDS